MAPEEWHRRIRDLLDERIARRDVWLMVHVEGGEELDLDAIDADAFVRVVAPWLDCSKEWIDEGGPGTNERFVALGDRQQLTVRLTAFQRSSPDGPLVANPERAFAFFPGEQRAALARLEQ